MGGEKERERSTSKEARAVAVVVIPQITLLNPICSVQAMFAMHNVSLCKCRSRLIWFDGLDLKAIECQRWKRSELKQGKGWPWRGS